MPLTCTVERYVVRFARNSPGYDDRRFGVVRGADEPWWQSRP